MNTITIGTINKPASRIGLGTWAIGGGPAWGGDKKLEESIEAIRKAPSLGVNVIDTAPGYNFGQSEKIVGEAIQGMDRDKLIIITKFGIVWDREGALFNKVGDTQLYKNLSPESVREEIDKSLERLQTDYVDVYMSHWQSVEPFFTPIEETMEVLMELKAQGKIKAIGAANVTVDNVKKYVASGGLDIVQAKYSILDRAIENELLPYCKEHKIAVQAYSPLEMGLLSGAIKRGYQPIGAQANKKWFQPENMPHVFDFLDDLLPLTEKYHCTVANLNLAWILAQYENLTILSGATTFGQLQENAASGTIDLDPGDVSLMREMAEALDKAC